VKLLGVAGGLLNLFEVPVWMSWLVTILVMDFVIWLQRVVTHKFPILWRLHQALLISGVFRHAILRTSSRHARLTDHSSA
jgi:hypothetical protein